MMNLERGQYLTIGGFVVFFFLLYFGCETKPKDIAELEKSRGSQLEATGFDNLNIAGRATLSLEDLVLVDEWTRTIAMEENPDSIKIETFKQLSSFWYQKGQIGLAGHWAEQIAMKKGDEESWSIAGTTYTLCIKANEDEKIRSYCTGRALKAFENARSLNPNEITHRINEALVFIENPLPKEPMKGILELRALNTEFPDNVQVINQLARLAIQTNQFDRAIERLTQALQLDPDNSTSICLLADAYKGSGDETAFEMYRQKCLAESKNL